MQNGRILLTIFFSVFSLLIIIFAGLSIFQARAQQKSKSVQKTAQIIELEISPFQTSPTSLPSPIRSSKIISLPSPAPTASRQSQSSNPNPNDYILEKVNEYRAAKGLSRVSPNSEICDFAKTRAREISSLETFNHDGFTSRINSMSLPYSSYSEVTENIAYNTDYKDVVNRWIASSGHELNLRKNTPHVCIGNYGDYYAYEGWRP